MINFFVYFNRHVFVMRTKKSCNRGIALQRSVEIMLGYKDNISEDIRKMPYEAQPSRGIKNKAI